MSKKANQAAYNLSCMLIGSNDPMRSERGKNYAQKFRMRLVWQDIQDSLRESYPDQTAEYERN